MTRKYSLLIEGDESGYSAHVPELPTILVTGRSVDELLGARLKRFSCGGRATKSQRRRPQCAPRSRWNCPYRPGPDGGVPCPFVGTSS
jgi:hypothetical protein